MAVEFESTKKPTKAVKQAQAMIQLAADIPEAVTKAIHEAVTKAIHKPAKLKEKTEGEVIADELIHLDSQMKKLGVDDMVKNAKKLKDKLQLIAKDAPPKEQVTFAGELGVVTLSAAGDKKVITDPIAVVQMLIEKFGAEVAGSVVSISLTELAKVLSGGEIEAVIKIEPGSRTCKINPSQI